MQFKVCTSCGKEKPVGKFHLDARSPDGYRSVCKVCRMNEGKLAKRHAAPAARFTPAAAPARQIEDASAPEDGAPDARQLGDDLTVDVPDEGQAKAGGSLFDSLVEAMKGTGETVKPSRSDREEREAVSEQMATLGGYLASVGARLAIPDPYKPAGPSPQHAHNVIKPLAEIVAERLDVAGHLSPTMVRLGESALALAMYGDYAIRTILTINETRAQHGNAAATGNSGSGSGRPAASAAEHARARWFGAGDASPRAAANGHGAAAGTGGSGRDGGIAAQQVRDGAGAAGEAGDGDAARNAAAVDALMRADADGRRRLGIV